MRIIDYYHNRQDEIASHSRKLWIFSWRHRVIVLVKEPTGEAKLSFVGKLSAWNTSPASSTTTRPM
jgi:hypothetical protein